MAIFNRYQKHISIAAIDNRNIDPIAVQLLGISRLPVPFASLLLLDFLQLGSGRRVLQQSNKHWIGIYRRAFPPPLVRPELVNRKVQVRREQRRVAG